jgi:sRNA-binding carbon storage regulator CsrA
MLALSRKPGESIKLFHRGIEVAEIEVARVNGQRVTLSLKADSDVRFVRNELLEETETGKSL